jgi:hypothetical protein
LSDPSRRFVMLSDRERETLREVQRQLESEDPSFARSFDALGKRDSGCGLSWAYTMPGATSAEVVYEIDSA